MSSTHLTEKSEEQFHPKNTMAASNMDDESTASVNKSTASDGESYTSEVKDGITKDEKTRQYMLALGKHKAMLKHYEIISAEFQGAIDKRDGMIEEYNASVDRVEAAEKMHDELVEKFEAASEETAAIQKDLKAAEKALAAKLDEHKDCTWRLWVAEGGFDIMQEKIIEEASKLEGTKKEFLAHVLDSSGQMSEGEQSEAEMARTGDEKGDEQETKVD
ncbi:hypothetical protein C1H76_5688 [Elsinoe australis]|uniref:Uncharacterized protein n=1 Tax=Elsinoe australis TaxID=40998 RepID=A0A4U7AXS1_9PEZI|nr:hypothetical protein C1H76_5688 [Elsinoe australis]